MRWIVRVALTMDDVKECHFTDKDKALKHIEALKRKEISQVMKYVAHYGTPAYTRRSSDKRS